MSDALRIAADYCDRHAADEALSADTLRSAFADLAAYIRNSPPAMATNSEKSADISGEKA